MINVIGGLPRSGSTIFCNILNQNEKLEASSTSVLPQLISNVVGTLSNSTEFRAELKDREATEDKIIRVTRSICFQWYLDQLQATKMVFDKSRGWNNNILMLRTMFPKSKAVIIVRDLRNVFASTEKQHRKNALLDESQGPIQKQLETRANGMFANTGLIGAPLGGIRDIINRELPVFFLRYEDLILHTEQVLKLFYQYIEQEPFEHNLNNIINTAKDPDWLYLYKFPHEGAGKMKRELNQDEWKNYFSDGMGERIVQNNQWFFEHFGYI